MKKFSQKVISIVAKIPKSKFLTYQEVAKRAGNSQAVRAVGNILAKNKNLKIPCHRVIKNNNEIGGYKGSFKNSWLKAALLLKEGVVGVISTDTIYGIVGSALNKNAVKKIYKFKKRALEKPMVILISSQDDLKEFEIKITSWQRKVLEKLWPGKVSVILNCLSKKFSYLHRRTNTLAFRVPAKKELSKILLIAGPLVAPSANWENYPSATTIAQAKKYFGNKVFYFNRGIISGKPSTLVKFTKSKLDILRLGAKRINLKEIEE